ncbi:MAG: thioredoxin family protein [Chloroflexi bacterium]|nr:thioredoxin family protein [Chloroflexota bacterium]
MTQPAAISAQQRNQLRRTFRKDLKAPVAIRLFTREPSPIAIPGRDCPTCEQTRQLVEEVSDASPKITLNVHDFFGESVLAGEMGITRIPALILGEDKPARIKFYGAPLGYQMAAIVETIRFMSRGVSPLRNDTRRKLRNLTSPVHMQVIVSPEEQSGAETAFTAFAMACESDKLSVEAVQIRDFPSLARTLGVNGLPMVLINDLHRSAGRVSEEKLIEQILAAGGNPSDQGMSSAR